MSNLRHIWFFFFWLAIVGQVEGQHFQGGNVSGSFSKFVDIPVSHYTGVPQITIPLTTVKEGPLEVPIALAYHSSGVKVGEVSSEIGLGWQLVGAGAIYRNVRGMMDEETRNTRVGYYLHGGTMTTNNTATLTAIGNNERDAEADLFSFYMPGYSGKFYFSGGDGTTPSEVVLVPQQDLKVEITDIECPSSGFCYIQGFKLTAPDGTKYFFGEYTSTADFDIDRTINANLSASNPLYDMATAWHLAKIETHDGKNDIVYKYITSNYAYETLAPSSLKVVYNGSTTQTPIHDPNATLFSGTSIRYHTMQVFSKVLDSIITRTQVIDFEHEDRTDVSLFTSPPKKWAISGLKIYEGSAACVSYAFDQSNFTDGTSPTDPYRKRLKLDKVQIKSCDGQTTIPAYDLTYIQPDGLTHRLSHAMDHWGYYNGKSTNNNTNSPTLIPTTDYVIPSGGVSFNYGSAMRDTDTTYAKRGLLQKVVYPTGGHTVFTYEGNVALDQNAPGAKAPLAYLSTGQSPTTMHCSIPGYETSAYLTLNQEKIDNGYFTIGVSNHIGACGNFTTNVTMEVIQSGQVKIFREINHNAPCETAKVALAGHGLSTSSTVQFKLTVNNEGEGFADIWYHPDTIADVTVGGMRIKQVRTYDGHDASKDIVRNFYYRRSFADNKSSADYIGRPLYGKLLFNYTLMAEPFSLAPLSSFEGYHIGYQRVEEELNGNGHSVYTYRDENFEHDTLYPAVGLEPRVLAGTVDSSIQYNQSENLLAFSSSTEKNDSYSNPGHFNIAYRNISGISTFYTNTLYWNPTRKPFRPETTINYLDGVITESEYFYSSNALQLQPNSITSTNSDGKETTISVKYAGHYEEGLTLLNYFRNNYMIGLPYSSETIVDGNIVDGSRTLWSFYNNSSGLPTTTSSGNFPYPQYQQRYERTWNSSGVLQTGNWRTLSTIHEYHMTFGAPERIQEDDWSQRYLNYDALGNIVRDSFLNFVKDYEFFTGSMLPKSITDIDDQKTSFTYDDLIRPSTITDNCSGTVITKTYGYQDATNSNYNWAKTHSNYVAVSGSAVDIIEDISYLDGLGREIEKVGKNQSQTSNRDLIYAVEFDNQGRLKKSFEPYHSTLTSGKYVDILSTDTFTLNEYEASPLNRVKKVTPPFWHPTEYFYEANTSGDVSGFAANELSKIKVKDGNGNWDLVFNDKKGREILKRQTNSGGSGANDVLYLYDDKNRLDTVLPPGATKSTANLLYTFTYDARDNVLRKKVPGKTLMEFVYNNRNLLAYSRDGYLGGISKWYAHQYDSYGREIFSGLYTGTPGSNVSFAQASISENLNENIYGTIGTLEVDKLKTAKSKILGTSNWLQSTMVYDACGRVTSTTGNSFVNLATNSETHSFSYDWMDNLLKDTYVHMGPAGTKNIEEVFTYDKVGRQDIYYHKIGSASQVQITNFDFNHKEQLVQKVFGPFSVAALNYHYLPNGLFSRVNAGGLGTADLFYEELKYDASAPFTAMNAPVQKNGNIAVVISQVKGHDRHAFGYQYDYLDRMTKATYLKLNGSSGGVIGSNDYNVDVTYDVRGNISTLSRKGQYRDGSSFVIDTIDKLVYNIPANSNVLTSVTDNAPVAAKAFGHRPVTGNYSYDTNGNITYDLSSGATFTYNHLDVPVLADLGDGKTIEWTYDGTGNMLQKLVKRGSTILENRRYVGAFEYGGNQIEMIYHAAGRLYNKNYDPEHIDLDGIITGMETAYGTEIQATALIETSSNVDFIADNYIELNENFTVVSGSEFDAIIGSGPTGEDWRYDYCIKDHLGNTRVIFSDLDNNGGISDNEIIAEYQYYPFGMRMDGDWAENTSLNNEKYQYNGIEYLQDHALNLNVARYRMLDPSIGRWLGVDPKAEATMGLSPYNSMGNNPISNVDPNGDFFFVAALGPILSGIVSGAIAGAAINGTASAISGGNFLNGAWKGAITGAVGGGLGAIGGGTFAANLALGTAEGAITGGIGSTLNGGNFWDGAKFGAFSGALLTTVSSENFGNLLKGEGFRNNSNVFSNLVDRGIGEQGILDYFGFDATFDSQMAADAKFWFNNQGAHGISIGPTSFESFGLLKGNYLKEAYHLRKYLKHGVGGLSAGELGDWWPEERLGAIFNYKNQGLYPGSTSNYLDIIGSTESMMSLFDYSHRSFTQRWWHFVYKIPRRY